MKKPDDDGLTRIQRLSPDQFDVVLGAHPSKQKKPKSAKTGSFGRTLVVMTALGIGAYALIPHRHTETPVAIAASPQPPEAVPDEPAAVPIAPVATAAPALKAITPTRVVIIEQHSAREVIAATPPPKPAQGMVSAAYMASFKNDLAHSSTSQRRVNEVTEGANIREADGHNRYGAQWRIFNNHIEGDSVCFNFSDATGERYECRKAAQAYFKDQCHIWTKHLDEGKEDHDKLMQSRYCEADKSFSPEG